VFYFHNCVLTQQQLYFPKHVCYFLQDVSLPKLSLATIEQSLYLHPVSHDLWHVPLSLISQGYLKMNFLPRVRYILEVMFPSELEQLHSQLLELLTLMTRHSLSAATQVRGQSMMRGGAGA